MASFKFRANSLYDPNAAPDVNEGYLHEDIDLGQRLAKQKRLAVWLREKLIEQGISPSNLVWDQSGWGFTVNGDDGFAMVSLNYFGGGQEPFVLIVAEIGEAKSEYLHTFSGFEVILRDNPEIESLEIAE